MIKRTNGNIIDGAGLIIQNNITINMNGPTFPQHQFNIGGENEN